MLGFRVLVAAFAVAAAYLWSCHEAHAVGETAIAVMKLADGKLFAPLLLVGKNVVKGYEEGAWQSALDLAGYPKSNQLPSNFPVKRVADTAPQAKDKEATTGTEQSQ